MLVIGILRQSDKFSILVYCIAEQITGVGRVAGIVATSPWCEKVSESQGALIDFGSHYTMSHAVLLFSNIVFTQLWDWLI